MNDLVRMSIETSNLCNLRCCACLHHGPLYRGQADHHPKVMDFDFYKSIVDQFQSLNSSPKVVTPAFQGEPLCYPKFIEACEYLTKKGIGLGFTTNGMLLTKEVTDFLIGLPNFSSIAFSIDGATKETNEKIRVGVSHEKLIENIYYFLTACRGRMTPISVAVNMTLMEENKKEYLDFIYKWTIVNNVQVQICVCTDEEGLPQKTYWRPEERLPCLSPTFFTVVLTSGEVVPCCRDHRYEMIMGNLHHQLLKEIWEGDKYKLLRDFHENRYWEKFLSASYMFLCKKCDTWMSDYGETMFRYKILDNKILVKQGPFWEQFWRIR